MDQIADAFEYYSDRISEFGPVRSLVMTARRFPEVTPSDFEQIVQLEDEDAKECPATAADLCAIDGRI